MSLIKPLSPALPAWFPWVSFSLFPNVDKVTMRQSSANQGHVIGHKLVSCSMLNLETITLYLSVSFQHAPALHVPALSITPPHRRHHITPVFLSNPYGCHSLHWLSSNRQVHFQPSPVPPFCHQSNPPSISPFYSILLLHRPSCVPHPLISPLSDKCLLSHFRSVPSFSYL